MSIAAISDQVDFISGRTRLFAIIGHPIEQVRSPEMFTAEFAARGADAILVPLHVLPEQFDTTIPALLAMPNLDGLIFTIPYKQRGMAFADEIGPNARSVGAINALARRPGGGWKAEIFDGIGCVEGFRRRGIGFSGKRVALIGAGGAGSAIAVAIAQEGPLSLSLHDLDGERLEALATQVRGIAPTVTVTIAPPQPEAVDILLNASPVGMLGDARMPIEARRFPPGLIVFDTIVMPETTPLLALAERSGCITVRGREMMRGQIARMTDYFGLPARQG